MCETETFRDSHEAVLFQGVPTRGLLGVGELIVWGATDVAQKGRAGQEMYCSHHFIKDCQVAELHKALLIILSF